MSAALSRIEKLRNKVKASKEGNNNRGNNVFPFWEIPLDVKAPIHILADANEENDNLFYVDLLTHTLDYGDKKRTIPCRKMYGDSCPICDLSAQYYKAEDKENGKKFYRDKKSIIRAIVLDDPRTELKEGQESFTGRPTNLRLSYQLMNKILAEAVDPELGDFTDTSTGTPFNIVRTNQGGYSNYGISSGFARKPAAVKAEYLEGLEPVDLATLIPRDFGLEKVTNMLQAYLNGDTWEDEDDKKDGDKPAAPARREPVKESVKETVKESKPAPVKEVAAPVEDDEDDGDDAVEITSPTAPVETTEDDGEDNILATLRRRKAGQARK
jgi:hypothetical protein